MSYDFLLPGESVIKEGNANMQQFGGMNKGGKMILTDKRIIFKAHAFNFGSKLDAINLSDITMTGNTINLLTPSPNMIQVKTNYGTQYQFVVTRKDKEDWLKQISLAADKIINSSENIGENNNLQTNTVYQEVTRKDDLKSQIKKWFSDYKNFKNLSNKSKAEHIVFPLIIIIIIISLL